MPKQTPSTYRNHPSIGGMFEPREYLQVPLMFFNMNGCLPNVSSFYYNEKKELFKLLISELAIKEEDVIEAKGIDLGVNEQEYFECLIPVKNDLLVYFNPGHNFNVEKIDVYYSPTTDKKLLEKVFSIIKKELTDNSYLNKLFLVQGENFSVAHLNAYSIKNNAIDLQKNYNDDFVSAHKIIVERLNTKEDKGLVLLHGIAGTGKTSYIRYLTSVINKRLIYISPDLASQISAPDFLSFISKHPNSVIVIEDAENIIEQRQQGSNSAVSNLLNLSDGLLADCLKIQIICSFNTDISKVDKALLRKGRLIAKYEFGALEIGKAALLSKSLGYNTTVDKKMTLAEIFNQNEMEFNAPEKPIGFSMS